MREILFRGKRIDNGEWVEGDLLTHESYAKNEVCIRDYLQQVQCEVIPETVGQFTGLRDCKRTKEYPEGQMIFEGDIVHAVYKSGYTGIPNKDFGIGVIKYSETYYSGAAYQIDIIGEPGCRVFSASLQVEVIGNVWDSKEA